MKTLSRRIAAVFLTGSAALVLIAQTPTQEQARTTLNLGVSAFKAGNTQQAVDLFTRALQLDPNFIEAELYLASAYSALVVPGQPNQDNAGKAVASFERVLQKQPTNIDAATGLASLYLNTGMPAKARDIYLQLSKSAPQNESVLYSIGALDWTLAFNKTNPLPEAERASLIEEGLEKVTAALNINPQFTDAMVYKNLLLRQKAESASDPAEKAKLTAEADLWFSRALEARRQGPGASNPDNTERTFATPPPPPPPPAPPPQRIGGDVAQANLSSTVTPVYPPLARAARVQGVVLLQTVIDKSGHVADLQVLSGHPLLNDAAVDAVRQWRYKPVLLNGQPIDVITTVTVNFVFQ